MSPDLKTPSSVGTKPNTLAFITLIATCVLLLIVNQKLRSQNIKLINQYRALSGREGPPVGSKISALHGTTVLGKAVTLDLSNRTQGALLLILSPSCPHCNANLKNWRNLMPMVRPDSVFLVDVSETADERYLKSIAMPSEVGLMRLTLQERSLYSVTLTPMTIWIGPHGFVKQIWNGELQDEDVQQIKATLLAAKG